MLTVKNESSLLEQIKTMSELEFSAFLKSLSEHIHKNNWEHIIDECFDIEDQTDRIEELEDKLQDTKEKLRDANGKLSEIRDIL